LESGSFLCFEEVRHGGPLRISGSLCALSPTRSDAESVLPPCHRPLAGRADGTTSRLDRGLTIRTKAATTAGAILAIAALAGCGGSDNKSSGISSKVRADYIAGCASTQQSTAGCQCLIDSMQKNGVDSDSKLQALSEKVKSATQSRNPAAFPQEFKQAITDCRSKLVKTPTP
jgi:hypothetical protein